MKTPPSKSRPILAASTPVARPQLRSVARFAFRYGCQNPTPKIKLNN